MEKNTELRIPQEVEKCVGSLAVNRQGSIYFYLKRFLDIVVSAIFLGLFSPLMLIIGILIRLDSPGPVFFLQTRVGGRRCVVNGRAIWVKKEFTCVKFRTMVQNADPTLHQDYIRALIQNDKKTLATIQNGNTKIKKLLFDPRITRVGKFLRKSSLDEVPQFWNVLKGEMSLVGPRPAIPYEVELYKPWHHKRLEAIPGITGYWQVTARSSVDFDEMVRLDIQYILKQSLWLDLFILLKTPIIVIEHNGAV
jgi:lipopolysaccharide/colanic/teichoic acid biosynthesis glycosyltransferase